MLISLCRSFERRSVYPADLLAPLMLEIHIDVGRLTPLGAGIGKPFVEARQGDRGEGRLLRRIDLLSGQFALVENTKEFTLLPWRPMLENQLGKSVSAMARGGSVDWTLGRSRGAPSIS